MRTPYYILLTCMFLLTALGIRDEKKLNLNGTVHVSTYYKFSVLLLLLFATLSDPQNYPDTPNYYEYFYTGSVNVYSVENVNIGYEWLTNIFRRIIPNYYVFYAFVMSFIIFSYSKFIKQYSPLPILSIFIFFVVAYSYSLFILRQYIAICFGLLSFKYTIEKKFKLYLISVLLAISFHTTAMVLLPIYFIYNFLEPNKRNIRLIVASAFVVVFGFSFIASFFLSGNEYYIGYLTRETESSTFRMSMKLFIMLVYIYTLREKAYEKGINYIVFLSLLLNVVIYAGLSNVYGAYRMRYFFEVSEIIGLPIILKQAARCDSSKRLIVNTLTYAYILFLALSFVNLISSEHFETGYKTILGML